MMARASRRKGASKHTLKSVRVFLADCSSNEVSGMKPNKGAPNIVEVTNNSETKFVNKKNIAPMTAASYRNILSVSAASQNGACQPRRRKSLERKAPNNSKQISYKAPMLNSMAMCLAPHWVFTSPALPLKQRSRGKWR